MKISFAFQALATLALAPRALAQGEAYVYAIYYGSEDCGDKTSVMRGYASDQSWAIQGASSANRNETGMNLCTLESLCIIHPTAHQCTINEPTTTDPATGGFSISEEGLIFECDSSNTDAECAYLDPECYGSSIYPHCNFQVATTSTLVEDPSVLQHNTAATDSALDETSYIIYYSDEECNNVEGLEGIVNNETNIIGITNDTISCRDAITCALHPEGDDLGKSCQDILGVTPPPTLELNMMPISEDGKAVPCEGDSCEPVSPDACVKSTIHAACYHRMPTAAAFFGSPKEFLPNYVKDDAAVEEAETESDESSTAEENGSPTAENGSPTTTEAPEETDSAGACHYSGTAVMAWVVLAAGMASV